MELNEAISQVRREYGRAISMFQPFRSPHEGLSIIREEYKELEEEVFGQFATRSKEKMRKEAKHLATMAIRFMVDMEVK